MNHPAMDDDCRNDQQAFYEQVQARLEMWICPYCGKEHTEEVARLRGCCGEVHCLEPETAEWWAFIEGAK